MIGRILLQAHRIFWNCGDCLLIKCKVTVKVFFLTHYFNILFHLCSHKVFECNVFDSKLEACLIG